jgi:hypothetical protein
MHMCYVNILLPHTLARIYIYIYSHIHYIIHYIIYNVLLFVKLATKSPEGTPMSVFPTSQVNVSGNNPVMQLRKASNHPYLIEFPLDEFVSTRLLYIYIHILGIIVIIKRIIL